ncbi:MAG: dienelactone hydrolase family protein [Candidatus Lustribacter sp.]
MIRLVPITLCTLALLAGSAVAGETTSVPASGGTPAVPAYIAKPPGGAVAPAVLVLHGCEGYGPAYSAVADWLAGHGYVGIAIDSLAPSGLHSACTDPTTGARVEAADARAALAWMRTQPFIDPNRLAIVGYSMGAIATLDVMDAPPGTAVPAGLQAAVTYYPGCVGRVAANDSVPLRILDGAADDWTPAPPCQQLADGAAAAGKIITITTYPGATHAFNIPGPNRTLLGHHLAYDQPAALDAAVQTLGFLQHYLVTNP